MKQPAPNQHYRLSLKQAKRDYQDGILTATGLVYYTIGIYRAPGQKLRVEDIDEFCQFIGINRATFYRAISKLKAKGRLEWEAIGGIEVWIPRTNVVEIQVGTKVSQSCETLSQDCETLSQDCETLSQDCETLSQDCDNNDLKPRLEKQSSALSDLFQIYSTYLNSFTTREKERFLKFARSKADQLPEPPQLVEKWIAANLDWVKEEFNKAYPEEASDSGMDQGSAPPIPDEKKELHPAIEAGLANGRIKQLDRIYNGLFDAEGNWWKVGEWIEMNLGDADDEVPDLQNPQDSDKYRLSCGHATRTQVKESIEKTLGDTEETESPVQMPNAEFLNPRRRDDG